MLRIQKQNQITFLQMDPVLKNHPVAQPIHLEYQSGSAQ